MTTFETWKDGEFTYCIGIVARRGDDNVSQDPKTIASYLRLQASSAFRDAMSAEGEGVGGSLRAGVERSTLLEIAARLGEAATAVNCDARNGHAPDWRRALASLQD